MSSKDNNKNINNIYSDGTSDKLEMEIMEDVKLYFHKQIYFC